MLLRAIHFLIAVLLFPSAAVAASGTMDVRKGFIPSEFNSRCSVFTDCRGFTFHDVISLPDSSFHPLKARSQVIDKKAGGCSYWLKFTLVNSSDDERIVFFYAIPVPEYDIYSNRGEGWKKEPLRQKNYSTALTVHSGDTVSYLIRVSLFQRQNYLSTGLVDLIGTVEEDPGYIISQRRDSFFYFMIVFIGMAGMMAVYLLINFIHLRDKSYYLYSFNILCIVAIVLLRVLYDINPGYELAKMQILLGPLLQIASHLFYFLFASTFLGLKTLLPGLHRFFRYVVYALLLYIAVDLFLFFADYPASWRLSMFFWARILLILIAFGSIVYAYRKPTLLLRLFAIGTFLMVFSATISFIFSYYRITAGLGLWSIPFFYFLLGYLIDIVFFTLCLGYKSRLEQRNKLKLERELLQGKAAEQEERLKLVLETQQKERDRMATDLHDELGSGLSTIRFLSESVKLKGIPATPEIMNIISDKSAELIDNMRQIIWSVNPEYDSLQELLLYMKKYCGEYAETNKLDWRFDMPMNVPDAGLPPGFRHNIFSIFKEALHNIVKHANATLITVDFLIKEEAGHYNCSLIIKDNGKGFETDSDNRIGNGLKNMRKRMAVLNGNLGITNSSGTEILVQFPLAK